MPEPARLTRRAVLGGGLAAAALLVVPGEPARPMLGNLFGLGVASGDPTPAGMVLWTRLAPGPLAEDGLGGMGQRRTDVDWQLAEDESFTRLVRGGTVLTGPELGHSVHVEPAGLRPGTEYFYRFRAAGEISPVGRTRTAPAPSSVAPMTMCFASCAHWEHGYYTAYRRLAEDEPDLVLFLGDYIYELAAGDAPNRGQGVLARRHAGPEAITLAQYRQRYAQYHSDADLQAAHAVAPWVPVFDDHEVSGDWAGTEPVPPLSAPTRRADALRAYWENMPLRAAARPDNGTMQIYRRLSWGRLATFHMLDTRQYRDTQPCNDEPPLTDCPERPDPTRTITGAVQERWLADGLRASRTRWNVIGQQVIFAGRDYAAGPAPSAYKVDSWDGYPGSRDRVIAAMTAAGAGNYVIVTGDLHSHVAADVHTRIGDPESPVVATELIATSITSNGDGSEVRGTISEALDRNPHIHYFKNRRGYVRTRLDAEQVRADFRILPYVSTPGAPVTTDATFVVPDRHPGLEQV